MAQSLGPDFHSFSMGGEWESAVDLSPFSNRKETPPRDPRAGPREGRAQEAPRQREGIRTLRPSLFCSALYPPCPRHPLARPVGAGGLQARGEKDPRLQPRPARQDSPHPHCPQRLGEGASMRERPAPPHPPRRRKPRGPPLQSPGGSDPGGDHPHPTKNSRAGWGPGLP